MGVRDEALGVTPGRTAPSADLGGKWIRIDSFVSLGNNTLTVSSQVVANTQMRTLRTEVGKGSM